MKERERLVVGGLVALMIVLWLGFLVHRSPRFAGSLNGGILAVAGSVLMLAPLLYALVKRVQPLKRFVTKYISMRTLLAWHIYAGVIGPILVILHTGHKFDSPLGVALTACTVIAVVSGFVGRYLMSRVSQEIHAKQHTLGHLKRAYEEVCLEVLREPVEQQRLQWFRHSIPRMMAQLFFVPDNVSAPTVPLSVRAVSLADSIADIEFAIRTQEAFRRAFRAWLRVHLFISATLYGLLILHIWSVIHFGLRWLG